MDPVVINGIAMLAGLQTATKLLAVPNVARRKAELAVGNAYVSNGIQEITAQLAGKPRTAAVLRGPVTAVRRTIQSIAAPAEKNIK